MLEDAGLAEHRAGVEHQVPQQRELGRRQRHRLARLEDLVGVLVEFEVGEGDAGAAFGLGHLAGSAQDRAQPGNDLFETERFGDVVVGAERQPRDLVLHRVLRRQEQHGRVDTVCAQATQHAHAVHPRHHHVENHRVGPEATCLVESSGAVARGLHLEALELQAHGQQFDDARLVVDDEHARFGNPVGHASIVAGEADAPLEEAWQFPVSLPIARKLPANLQGSSR